MNKNNVRLYCSNCIVKETVRLEPLKVKKEMINGDMHDILVLECPKCGTEWEYSVTEEHML